MQRLENTFLNPELEERWGKVCPEVDSVLGRYAKLRKGNIEQWVSGIPSRVLLWQKDGFDYTVSMMTNYSDPSRLTVWGAVWRDNEADLTRESIQLDAVELQGPVYRQHMAEALVKIDRGLKVGLDVFQGKSDDFEVWKTPLAPKPN